MFFITPPYICSKKVSFLGLFCKVIGNIRNYLRLFNDYAALAYVLLMELAFEDF